VEPYNAVLSTHALMDYADVTTVLDNEAIYNLCHHKLRIEKPAYSNLNHIIAQVVSTMTSSLRFEGSLNTDINEFKVSISINRLYYLQAGLISSFADQPRSLPSNSLLVTFDCSFDTCRPSSLGTKLCC